MIQGQTHGKLKVILRGTLTGCAYTGVYRSVRLERQASRKEDQVEVKSIRIAFNSIKNAVVVIASSTAGKLRKESIIKIGWVSCRVVETKEE